MHWIYGVFRCRTGIAGRQWRLVVIKSGHICRFVVYCKSKWYVRRMDERINVLSLIEGSQTFRRVVPTVQVPTKILAG